MFDNQYTYIDNAGVETTAKVISTRTLPLKWKMCRVTFKTVKLIGTKKKTKIFTIKLTARVYNNYILYDKLDKKYKLIKLIPVNIDVILL